MTRYNFSPRWFAIALFVSVALTPAMAQTPPPVKSVQLDGRVPGRTFDGLGAVSGGGNSSRLLPDYPPAQRKEILDFLFKPKFGASLNDLKVEVGGDINSTQGSEPSHMHTATDENYNRGFEWWLMEQAKQRNPKIILECLAWGAPGWVGNNRFWSSDMMNYYIKFIKGAQQHHGLTITTVGGKNESGYDKNWYIGFRQALDSAGLKNVLLVGSDDWGPGWLNIATDSLTDSNLAKSVNAFAGHVTWSENPAVPSSAILATGKPLWDTEMHNYDSGSQNGIKDFDAEISLVHDFNYNYIHAKITKTLFWYLLWSTYPISSYPDVGMIRANTPWSGHYEVLPELWGYAHIDQFVQPGWRFLDGNANGFLPAGGTYTTIAGPGGAYSVIIESKGASVAQIVQLSAVGGLSHKTVHVWTSTNAAQFVHSADITPDNGAFNLVVAPNIIDTITTTTGQQKGAYPASPPDYPLPLPYHDDYQSYPVGTQARYHFDYEGAFEIANKTGGGKCLRQAATKSASGWGGAYFPLTFLGASTWTNYTVSVDAEIENGGAVSLHGRIDAITDGTDDPPGYTFRIYDDGNWQLKSYKTVIATGNTSFGANQWHNLKLSFSGSLITAYVDNKSVATVTDSSHSSGLVGLGSGWNFADFSNLEVDPLP